MNYTIGIVCNTENIVYFKQFIKLVLDLNPSEIIISVSKDLSKNFINYINKLKNNRSLKVIFIDKFEKRLCVFYKSIATLSTNQYIVIFPDYFFYFKNNFRFPIPTGNTFLCRLKGTNFGYEKNLVIVNKKAFDFTNFRYLQHFIDVFQNDLTKHSLNTSFVNTEIYRFHGKHKNPQIQPILPIQSKRERIRRNVNLSKISGLEVFMNPGLGDMIAIDSFLTEEQKKQIRRVYIYHVFPDQVRKIFSIHPIWKKKEIIDLAELFSLPQSRPVHFETINDLVSYYNLDFDTSNILNLGGGSLYRILSKGNYKFIRSSYYEDIDTDISKFNLPNDYIVLHLESIQSVDYKKSQRAINQTEFNDICSFLEDYGYYGVVVGTGSLDINIEHNRIINLLDRTTIQEVISIVKNSKGFIGIGSFIAVLASKHYDKNRNTLFLVKTDHYNMYENKWAYIYYAPIQDVYKHVRKSISYSTILDIYKQFRDQSFWILFPSDTKKAFFSATYGDLISIESFLNDNLKKELKTWYLATFDRKNSIGVRELIKLHPYWKNCEVIDMWEFGKPVRDVFSLNQFNRVNPVKLIDKNVIDLGQDTLYPKIVQGIYRYTESIYSEIKDDFTVEEFGLPSQYFVIQGSSRLSAVAKSEKFLERYITRLEWDEIINFLEKNNVNAVVLGKNDYKPVVHDKILDLINKTSLLEVLHIVNSNKCIGYIGIDSFIACLFARKKKIEYIRVKTRNEIMFSRNWAKVFYSPLTNYSKFLRNNLYGL